MAADTAVSRRTFVASMLAMIAVAPLGLAREALAAPRPFAFEHGEAVSIWVGRGWRFDVLVKDRAGRVVEVHRRTTPKNVHHLHSEHFDVVPVTPPGA